MALGWIDTLFVNTLKRALEASKTNPIPRTGEDGKAVDCYSVYVTDENGSYLAESIVNDSLIANQWNEDARTHNLRRELDLNQLEKLNFEISHYHGLVTHSYNTKGMFLRYEVTKFYKVVSFYVLSKYTIPKFIHSNKPLKKPDRITILETLDRMTEDSPHRELTSMTVTNQLYGMWSILNSKRKSRMDRVQRILESLVESGELRAKDSFTFIAKGRLLVTLEHLKEEKARQHRVDSNARWITVLTFILVITALFQSNLVETEYKVNLDELAEWIVVSGSAVIEWVLHLATFPCLS